MTAQSLARAKLDVYRVCQSGKTIVLAAAGTKDAFGTETGNPNTLTLPVFPPRKSQTSRKLQEQISWADKVDAIVYVPKHALDLVPIKTQALKAKYGQAKFESQSYKVDQCEDYGAFGTDYLYVLLGLKK